MSLFRPRNPQERDAAAREALRDAVAELRRYQAGGITVVPVADVLVLLGAAPEVPPVPEARRDPQADPLTGCRSVLPGS